MLKVYIGFSFSHHGQYAGYDQIKCHVDYSKFIECQKSFFFVESIFKKRTLLSRIYGRLFGARLWWIEFKLILTSIINPQTYIFHIIYGESIFKYLGYFKFGNKIALTLHQPPSFFENSNQRSFIKQLKKVDKLIVMSTEMEVYFKKKFPQKEILFIPHGVNTNFFMPKGQKNNQILIVGSWLRDFEFASRVFSRFILFMPDILITVVTKKENHIYFQDNTNVRLLSSIEDVELLNAYQQSKVVFLPLKQFTANNALLEALACGCKVIVATEFGYLKNSNKSPILYVNDNVEDVCRCFIEVFENWGVYEIYNSQSFVSENYSWEFIGKQTKFFLNQ